MTDENQLTDYEAIQEDLKVRKKYQCSKTVTDGGSDNEQKITAKRLSSKELRSLFEENFSCAEI